MGDAHSVCHNTSPGVALPTPSRFVKPLHASSGFLWIDTSEICVRQLNPELQFQYHAEYRAQLREVVRPIYTPCYNSYA